MNNAKMHEEFGRIVSQGLFQGILLALKLLWPFILAALVFGFIMRHLNARQRRAARDAEYRRMAKIFKEVNDDRSSDG